MSREIDAQVALKVMGWTGIVDILMDKRGFPPNGICPSTNLARVPHYSTRIKSVWQVVQRINAGDFSLTKDGSRWFATFVYDSGMSCEADTAPMAIALAALKVVGVEVAK